MTPGFFTALWHRAQYIPLWSALSAVRLRSLDHRARLFGAMVGAVMRWYPPARWRFDREVLRVFPDMPRARRAVLRREMGRNMGRTLFEILHSAEFQANPSRFHVSGPGLAALERARAEGKGAIVVSGHFGQWDAVRAVLKARGMETGAVYRPQQNRFYQRGFLAGIEAAGRPVMATGRAGTMDMVRHLRRGGFMAILLDEKYAGGAPVPFLGHPALTSTAAAALALKHGLPLVPAYGTRRPCGSEFDVAFEAPIPHTDAHAMTAAVNDSLSARVLRDPAQWYWMLRRWDGA
ncbi:lysophospholipid acyltransferase family protein [Rhodobaculum claviforme]|uniref:Acyltransferase n=1 Tax=Rhodobaculum claviforme TaxID=1549854 RepID=A0A934WII9_9RHOB|nr:lysophospholipid acyltransferase family protein [Rhodobaculum claviforme]MBK5926896.1 acyltransferase [Rhodobaculum claviforme]